MNDITVYDGLTESERVEAINQFGVKAMTGKAAYAMNSKWAGDVLNCQKLLVDHGQWMPWVEANVEQGQQWANEAMRISNYWRANNLTDDDLKSIGSKRQVTLVMQSEKPATAPRASRKPADVVVSVPDESDETNEAESDDDPTPDQPTQRKTAKGSEKIPEDKKPRTQQVPVEIVDDEPESDPWEYMTFGDIIAVAISKLGDDTQQKKAAKQLRKLADKLDPPKQTAIPTVDRMMAEIPEDWSDTLTDAAGMWARYRQGLVKAKRIQSIEAWIAALEHMGEQPEEVVVRKIRTAVESSWQGWDVEKSNGSHGNGAANRGATSKRRTAAEIFG